MRTMAGYLFELGTRRPLPPVAYRRVELRFRAGLITDRITALPTARALVAKATGTLREPPIRVTVTNARIRKPANRRLRPSLSKEA